jgi:hypothetical protein
MAFLLMSSVAFAGLLGPESLTGKWTGEYDGDPIIISITIE